MTERPYTVPSLAERWQCDERKIYAAIQAKVLPAFRLGRAKLIRIPVTVDTEEYRAAVSAMPKPKQWQIIANKLQNASAGYDGQNWVYFFRAGRYVKIGYSVDPASRAAAFTTTMPFDDTELLGAMPGGVHVEKAIHQALTALHHRHEWFRLTRSLRYAIREVCHG